MEKKTFDSLVDIGIGIEVIDASGKPHHVPCTEFFLDPKDAELQRLTDALARCRSDMTDECTRRDEIIGSYKRIVADHPAELQRLTDALAEANKMQGAPLPIMNATWEEICQSTATARNEGAADMQRRAALVASSFDAAANSFAMKPFADDLELIRAVYDRDAAIANAIEVLPLIETQEPTK